MYCDNCGAEVDLGQTYCTNCGLPVNGTPVEASPQQPQMHQSNSVPVLAVACTILAMVLFGLSLVATGVVDIKGANVEQVAAKTSKTSNTEDKESATLEKVTQETETATEKETVIVESEPEPEPEPEPVSRSSSSSSGYIIPDSASRALSYGELTGFSNWELCIARNEIYARHGRGFVTPEIQNYFYGCSWYQRTIDPDYFNDEAILSSLEMQNALTIREVERDRGSEWV